MISKYISSNLSEEEVPNHWHDIKKLKVQPINLRNLSFSSSLLPFHYFHILMPFSPNLPKVSHFVISSNKFIIFFPLEKCDFYKVSSLFWTTLYSTVACYTALLSSLDSIYLIRCTLLFHMRLCHSKSLFIPFKCKYLQINLLYICDAI